MFKNLEKRLRSTNITRFNFYIYDHLIMLNKYIILYMKFYEFLLTYIDKEY